MSRFVGSLALALALSSLTASRAGAQHFAQPPAEHGAPAAAAVVDRATLRAKLADARAVNVTAFAAYERARVYPSNTTTPGPLNVWRDAGGHLCAAATIIDRSGAHELVRRVGDTDNNLRLATVHDGPVMTWMLESGLTQEELVAIQKPFNPVARRPQPAPQPIDDDLRAKETARLAVAYQQVEKQLAAETDAALDTATDRLLAHPELAAEVAAR
jgi:hypothetical protein